MCLKGARHSHPKCGVHVGSRTRWKWHNWSNRFYTSNLAEKKKKKTRLILPKWMRLNHNNWQRCHCIYQNITTFIFVLLCSSIWSNELVRRQINRVCITFMAFRRWVQNFLPHVLTWDLQYCQKMNKKKSVFATLMKKCYPICDLYILTFGSLSYRSTKDFRMSIDDFITKQLHEKFC